MTLLFREMPRRLLVCRRWVRGRCWLCALSNVCCGFMSKQQSKKKKVPVLWWNLFGVQVPASSFNGHDYRAIWTNWCLLGKFCCVGKTQSGMFISMSSRGSTFRLDSFSLLQASNVTIVEPSLPLLNSSSQQVTAWWCWLMCTLFRVRWVHPKKHVWSSCKSACRF